MASSLNCKSLHLMSGGSLQSSPAMPALTLMVEADVTVEAGCLLMADGMVPAPGGISGSAFGGGGGFGGFGGNGQDGTPGGLPYGSPIYPIGCGSAGGRSDTAVGGSGGGSIRLEIPDGTLTVDGVISCNGTSGEDGSAGGGAGGSISIDVATLTGTGVISASGGAATTGGGGAGGRIAINYEEDLFAGTTSAAAAPAMPGAVRARSSVGSTMRASGRSEACDSTTAGRQARPNYTRATCPMCRSM